MVLLIVCGVRPTEIPQAILQPPLSFLLAAVVCYGCQQEVALKPAKMIRLICSVCDRAVFHERETRKLWRQFRDAGWSVGVTADGTGVTGDPPPHNGLSDWGGVDPYDLEDVRYKVFMLQMLREPMYEHSDGKYICGGCAKFIGSGRFFERA